MLKPNKIVFGYNTSKCRKVQGAKYFWKALSIFLQKLRNQLSEFNTSCIKFTRMHDVDYSIHNKINPETLSSWQFNQLPKACLRFPHSKDDSQKWRCFKVPRRRRRKTTRGSGFVFCCHWKTDFAEPLVCLACWTAPAGQECLFWYEMMKVMTVVQMASVVTAEENNFHGDSGIQREWCRKTESRTITARNNHHFWKDVIFTITN